MVVQDKLSDDATVHTRTGKVGKAISRVRPTLDQLPLTLRPATRTASFSAQWLPSRLAPTVRRLQPDIVNLHWIGKGFVSLEEIARLPQPLVWTLHDMWPLTGGCHYSGGCTRFHTQCGACPILHSSREHDLSAWVWRRKRRAWSGLPLTLVAPSRWMAEQAQKSARFAGATVRVIPYGIDASLYQPLDRRFARQTLGLPQDKRLALFGAVSATSVPRKGFAYLQQALHHVAAMGHTDVELVVFGSSAPPNAPDLGMPVHYLGKLSDDVSLALTYAAADLFVAPSIEDNLPNTVMEALACGTPVVAFHVGGIPDMVQHQENGYLASPFSVEELAQGMMWVMEDEARHQRLSATARATVERRYTLAQQAQQYSDLYQELLERPHA